MIWTTSEPSGNLGHLYLIHNPIQLKFHCITHLRFQGIAYQKGIVFLRIKHVCLPIASDFIFIIATL